ncbi:MAG: hypothetical protein ACRYFX_11695 [Janthinobacterium lividum]
MKNSLLLLAGAAAFSLSSCSQTTSETTTAAPQDSPATAATTAAPVMDDAAYHMRGDRMAMKFASANKITDQAMMDKLKMAYYQRAKRYDDMVAKYKADTTGMGTARRQYMTDTDKDFQGVLTDKTQYQSYQSSMADYDESGNMDVTGQGAASSDGGNTSSDNGSMSNGASTGSDMSSSTPSTGSDMSSSSPSGGSDMSGGAGVEKSKTKMADGSKIKVQPNGSVKVKDGAGGKMKM